MTTDAESASPLTPQERHRQLTEQIRAAKRLLAAKKARDGLIDFTRFTMPTPEAPDDPEKSTYQPQYFHRALGRALEEVEAGKMLRLIVTFPPRHGKSELTSRRFPAWLIGRDPYRHVMFATYNQPFAEDFGRDVRKIMRSPGYAQVFPGVALATGEQASDRLRTEQNGMLVFVGRGGSSTGRGADFLIIDDPLKDRAEADSAATREELWSWFNDTASTRLMSDTGSIIIISTRWHEDDLVGRLTDPANPCFNEQEARAWRIINIPAIAEDGDVLGRKPGEPLWPERFGLEYLESFRRRNPRGFSALYQQRPTPMDGDFFKRETIVGYGSQRQRPQNLRIYAASDHAVSTKQTADRTCLIVVGVDERDEIWLLDCWWERAPADVVADKMLDLMRRWKPIFWWAEAGHISKAIGPFLRKRQREEGVYRMVVEQQPAADKQTRAASIQGRMGMGMVHFPTFAPWYERAVSEMLKFPNARHDDFVDALAHIGLGLDSIRAASAPRPTSAPAIRTGSLAWIKAAAEKQRREAEQRKAFARW